MKREPGGTGYGGTIRIGRFDDDVYLGSWCGNVFCGLFGITDTELPVDQEFDVEVVLRVTNREK
jgi:hypothetical protein